MNPSSINKILVSGHHLWNAAWTTGIYNEEEEVHHLQESNFLKASRYQMRS